MSRVERVESLLRQIKDETRVAFDEHTQLYHKMQSLESENARLRELVRDMWPSYCYANGGNGETYLTYEQDADIRGRVRELGVMGE